MGQLEHKSLISRSASSALKIIFEMMVLFHHLYLVSTTVSGKISGLLGPIAVGGFFLLSGYGVGINFKKSEQEYCSKLLKKRLPSTYLMILIANLFYLFLYYYLGNSFDNAFDLIISVLYLPVFGGFVALSHYIYFLADLLVYYIAFLIFAYLFRNHKKKIPLISACMLALMFVVIIVLSIINAKTGSSRHMRAGLCFPLGLLICYYEDEICKFLNDYKWLVVAALFVSGFACSVTFSSDIVSEYIISVLIPLAIIVALYGVSSKRKSLKYLESLVLYVYVSHEFFRELLNKVIAETHQNFRGLMSMLLSVVVAIIICTVLNIVAKKKKAKETVLPLESQEKSLEEIIEEKTERADILDTAQG